MDILSLIVFEDIYNAIDNKNLEKIVTNEVADFGILSTIQKDELEWLYQQLAYEAKKFSDAGNERAKLGLDNKKTRIIPTFRHDS